ncbi:MAG: thermosome subunit beta [Candidatus Micrarchaeota archaeon]
MTGQGQLGGQQVYVLPEGSSRLIGRDAQRTNIAVAYAVANTVRTTLGPRGMDKMLVSEMGDIVITNDGATILGEMNVEHPAAKIMVQIAKMQDKEVGDGTTTAVVLAGELLKRSGELLDEGIHASTIIGGYNLAAEKAGQVLNAISKPVKLADTKLLERIASISMGSKSVGVGDHKDTLAKLVVKAVKQVAEERDGKVTVDADFIKIEKKEGGDISMTQFIDGVLIDKEIVHSGMPKRAENAKILLLDNALEIEKTETDAKIEISSPNQLTEFLAQEENMLKDMVEKVAKSKANVVFCQKGIDDVAQHFLSKKGIMAVRRVKKSDMEKLAKATGAMIATSFDDISEKDMGFAGSVYEKKVSGEQMVFVEKCKDPKSVTLFVRASTEHVVNEGERAVKDAVGAVSSAIEDGAYVFGGGSVEMELAQQLRKYAIEIGGRQQFAIQSFAEALESIPRTLAESTGMDVIDTLAQLRAKHDKPEGLSLGVDVYHSQIADMEKLGVVEPSKVKKQAISSASEATEMILRIDDMISAKSRPAGGMPPGGMGGMGGEMD